MEKINLTKMLAVLILLLPNILTAATLVVGPGDSLRDAIDAAMSGDTILIETNDTILESNVVDKTLTIAAGEGFTPVLKGTTTQALSARPRFGTGGFFFTETVVLTIDGLTVEGLGAISGQSEEFHTGLVIRNSIIKSGLFFRGFGTTSRALVEIDIIDSTIEGVISTDGAGMYEFDLTVLRSRIDGGLGLNGGGDNKITASIYESTIAGSIFSDFLRDNATSSVAVKNSTIGGIRALLTPDPVSYTHLRAPRDRG